MKIKPIKFKKIKLSEHDKAAVGFGLAAAGIVAGLGLALTLRNKIITSPPPPNPPPNPPPIGPPPPPVQSCQALYYFEPREGICTDANYIGVVNPDYSLGTAVQTSLGIVFKGGPRGQSLGMYNDDLLISDDFGWTLRQLINAFHFSGIPTNGQSINLLYQQNKNMIDAVLYDNPSVRTGLPDPPSALIPNGWLPLQGTLQ